MITELTSALDRLHRRRDALADEIDAQKANDTTPRCVPPPPPLQRHPRDAPARQPQHTATDNADLEEAA